MIFGRKKKKEAEARAPEQGLEKTAPAPSDEGPLEAETPPKKDPETAPETAPQKAGFLGRLKKGLSKSSDKLSTGITDIFTKKKLDEDTLEELEELLISADLGVEVAMTITETLSKQRLNKEVTDEDIKAALADIITPILAPVAQPIQLQDGLNILMIVGVNGAGKTTTIGKLAAQFKAQGKSVMLAAGDTFRAAAIEQLQIWGERTGTPVVASTQGADAAALAFDAVKRAQNEGVDVLLLDTAGRLHNRTELMDELAKVRRTIAKLSPEAPHQTLLVLDATTGQNAIQQTKTFQEMVAVSGLIVTKLDGTAKGGVLVNLAQTFGLPVHAIGVGEQVDDLQALNANDFARGLLQPPQA